jgi:hypothetical protein
MSTEKTYCNFYGAYAKIYTLSDFSGNVFYVGCTVNPIDLRLQSHLNGARSLNPNTSKYSSNSSKSIKIREMEFNVAITIVDMKWVTSEFDGADAIKKAFELEKEWIKKYIDLGYSLCNREARSRKEKEAIPEFVGQTLISNSQCNISIKKSCEDKPTNATVKQSHKLS